MVTKNKPTKNKFKFASTSMILIIVAVLLAMTMSGCLGPDADSDSDVGNPSGSQGTSLDNEESDQEEPEDENAGGNTNSNTNNTPNAGASSFPDVVQASGSTGGSSGSSRPWLASVPNPFIGTWVSDADDNGASLTFIGSSDGTFEYEMANLPASMASFIDDTGNGAYLVTKDLDGTNVIVSYFDSGVGTNPDMVQSSKFVVRTNNLIEVTEFTLSKEPGEEGQKIYGETTAFRREGTASRDDYVPTELSDNIFSMMELGWGLDLPEPDADIRVQLSALLGRDYYSSVWKFYDNGIVDCTFIDFGMIMGADTKDLTYPFSYVIYDDDSNPFDGTMILYTGSAEDGNELFI
jgi:hypothetical protein